MIQNFLHVYLRGNPYPVVIPMESGAVAQESVAFASATWLRKCPQDRAGAWQVGLDSTQVTAEGVGVASRALAVFDPREVAAVRCAAQTVDDVP